MSTSETNFSCSLANPIIRSAIKGAVQDIKWDSVLAKKVVSLFLGESISGTGKVADATIRAYLSAENLLEDEIESIITRCHDYQELGKNIDHFISSFNTFYKRKMVTAIIEESTKNPEDTASEIVRRIGSMKKIDANVIPIHVLGDLNVDKVMSEELGDNPAMPSVFPFIKGAMPLGGYLRGQVVQIVGAPGTGKSLFLMNEAINLARLGYKGVYFALGDLMLLDFITRFSAIMTQNSFSKCMASPKDNWSNEVTSVLKNIKVIVVPAGTMDADALADLLEARVQEEENVDFVVVDYDSNFKKTSDTMYEEGDSVYNKMSEVSRPSNSTYRTVFIASQPKQWFWDKEILPLESANESSRKQAIIDVMITLGKMKNSTKKCGKINIPKNRRGISDVSTPYMVEEWGQITEIDQGQYNLLKSYTSEDSMDKTSYGKKQTSFQYSS